MEYYSSVDNSQCCIAGNKINIYELLYGDPNIHIENEAAIESDGCYYFLFVIKKSSYDEQTGEANKISYQLRNLSDDITIKRCITECNGNKGCERRKLQKERKFGKEGEDRRINHPCISDGEMVVTAGVLVVNLEAKKIVILPDSGHYHPSYESIDHAESLLKKLLPEWNISKDDRKIGNGLYEDRDDSIGLAGGSRGSIRRKRQYKQNKSKKSNYSKKRTRVSGNSRITKRKTRKRYKRGKTKRYKRGKTRKTKRYRGGSGGPVLIDGVGEVSEELDEEWIPAVNADAITVLDDKGTDIALDLFSGTHHVNALEVIYQGGPRPSILNIGAHGRVTDCANYYRRFTGDKEGERKESRDTGCFTLIPRGYKLILPVATSENLGTIGSGDMQSHQIDPTYFRIYEGLVPEHELNFNLVYPVDDDGYLRGTEAGIIKITLEDAATIVSRRLDARKVKTREFLRDFNKMEAQAEWDGVVSYDIGVKMKQDHNIILSNYPSTPHVTEGDVYLQTRKPSLTLHRDGEEILRTNPDANAELLTASHQDYIIPRTEIKDQIMGKPGAARYRLSQILRRIEIAGEKEAGRDQPRNIFGSFCRGGEFNYNIDQLLKCNSITELPPLSPKYFDANRDYEGVTDELRRNESLASKSKAQDFWSIYDEINKKFKEEYFTTGEIGRVMERREGREAAEALVSTMLAAFQSVQKKIETTDQDGISLSLNDVCIIFQIDNTIMVLTSLVRFPLISAGEIEEMYYPTV